MNWRNSIRRWVVVLAVLTLGVNIFAGAPVAESTIYNPNPNHLWNRLNETLFMRTGQDGAHYGWDEMDPLYWAGTKHLLEGESHQQALAILDKFLDTHGEQLVQDPLKRAWLQHDLWWLFDWAASPGTSQQDSVARRELETRLLRVMQRVALTPKEIESLPDNYAASGTNSELMKDAGHLLDGKGGWAYFNSGFGDPTASAHAKSFYGHSVFLVMIRFPGGVPSAELYFKQLADIHPKWVPTTNSFPTPGALELNRTLPQFPTNTQWALVRQMCLIDSDGQIRATHLTESIQTRNYLSVAPQVGMKDQDRQSVAEFRMGRRDNAALRTVSSDEHAFFHFFSKGVDPFEDRESALIFRETTLGSCYICHNGSGIYSVLSYTGTFSQRFGMDPRGSVDAKAASAEWEAKATAGWKGTQFDWGLLQGLWLQNH
jgi:hypothetical protein